jgi:FMN phosphatase YigB (HAD superfamily)
VSGNILEETKLDPFVDVVVTSRSAGVAKPDPRAFDAVLDALNERGSANNDGDSFVPIAPQDVLHIGDSVDKDYRAAVAAGMHGMLVLRDPDMAVASFATGSGEEREMQARLKDMFSDSKPAESRPKEINGVPIDCILPDLMPLHSGY